MSLSIWSRSDCVPLVKMRPMIHPVFVGMEILFTPGGKVRVTPLRVWQEKAAWTGPAVALSSDGRHLLTVQTDQQVNAMSPVVGKNPVSI